MKVRSKISLENRENTRHKKIKFTIKDFYSKCEKIVRLLRVCSHLLNKLLTDRCSHQKCSVKKGVLKNFAKFTGKHLCQSLFLNKVAGQRPATLLKEGLWHRYFRANFEKCLRAPSLQNTSGQLLLDRYPDFLCSVMDQSPYAVSSFKSIERLV